MSIKYQGIIEMEFIKNKYEDLSKQSGGINVYLSKINKYAKECETIIELGVKNPTISWTLVNGLLDNNKKTKILTLNNVKYDVDELLKETQKTNVKINCVSGNIDNIKEVDMTIIDTWHVYGQLKRDLIDCCNRTNKYIIIPNTSIDEWDGEAIRTKMSQKDMIKESALSGIPINEIKMGIWPAINDFLKNHGEWTISERCIENNGLTILKKLDNKHHLFRDNSSTLAELYNKYGIKSSKIKNDVSKKHNQGGDCVEHGYDVVYNLKFKPYRNKQIKLCEVGVLHGHAIYMYSKYFSNIEIYGYDINIDFVKQFQKDPEFWDKLKELKVLDSTDSKKTKEVKHMFDIIVDDGDHRAESMIKTFANFYPKLKKDGLYVIEDAKHKRYNVVRKYLDKMNITHEYINMGFTKKTGGLIFINGGQKFNTE